MKVNMKSSIVKNSLSHVLSKKENRTVKNTLGQDRISISTTFAQLYITSPSEQECCCWVQELSV